jgi:hypothetical protein
MNFQVVLGMIFNTITCFLFFVMYEFNTAGGVTGINPILAGPLAGLSMAGMIWSVRSPIKKSRHY